MIGVIFFWEDNVKNYQSGREIDMDVWRESIKPWDVSVMIAIDQDGQNPVCGDRSMNFESYPSLADALEAHSDMRRVFLEVPRVLKSTAGIQSQPLTDLCHPADDVLYIVGPDSGHLRLSSLDDLGYVRDSDYVVTIDTPLSFSMWSLPVICIVLYDRMLKLGG